MAPECLATRGHHVEQPEEPDPDDGDRRFRITPDPGRGLGRREHERDWWQPAPRPPQRHSRRADEDDTDKGQGTHVGWRIEKGRRGEDRHQTE